MKKVLLMTMGSRGDVQPFLALCLELQKQGFDILVTSNRNHVPFFEKCGVDCAGVHFDMHEFMTTDTKMIHAMETGRSDTLNVAFMTKIKENYAKSLDDTWKVVEQWKPDIIVSGVIDVFTGHLLSHLLKIPCCFASLSIQGMIPVSSQVTTDVHEPCCHFGMALLSLKIMQSWVFRFMAKIARQKFGGTILTDDDPLWADVFPKFVSEWMNPSAIQLVASSELAMPMPTDLPESYVSKTFCSGYWIVSQDKQEHQMKKGDDNFGGNSLDRISKFLEHGTEPPVYMGWGSMVTSSPQKLCTLAVQSLMIAKKRGIVLGGWSDINEGKIPIADPELASYASTSVLFVSSAPHEWLFPQCSVIIHHGGAGTTACGLRSGVPSIVTPWMFDQFFHATLVQETGAGIGLPALKNLKAQQLADAITECTSNPIIMDKAKVLGNMLQKENGVENAVRLLKKFGKEEVDTGKWLDTYRDVVEWRRKRNMNWCYWITKLLYTRNFDCD